MRVSRIPGAALRVLRYLLPVCLVAASVVAAMGLFRVVGRSTTEPLSQQAPSLHLGARPGAFVPAAAIPTPGPINKRSPPATPSPAPRPTAKPSTLAALTAPVVVFNASGVSGLAGRTAATLRRHGVKVASIGNLSSPPQPVVGTAVYYAPALRRQAQALARLSGAATISPAPTWLGSAGTLVLVLTRVP